MSFEMPTDCDLIDRIEHNFSLTNSSKGIEGSFAFANGEFLILAEGGIARVRLNTWADIYNGMIPSENVQLL
jgi:hypothetical protein